MKKILLSNLFLLGVAATCIIGFSSNSGGSFTGGSGCTCHGTNSTNTSLTFAGILGTTFTPGQTYTLAIGVTNLSKTGGGFNLKCSEGTFTAGTGTKVNATSTEITHTATSTATSGVNGWVVTWTAPNTETTVNFNLAGNAVNKNNGDSGDQPNAASYTYTGAFPASINSVKTNKLTCIPTNNGIALTASNLKNVSVYNYSGQKINTLVSYKQDATVLDISNLANGYYLVVAEQNGKPVTGNFIK
jgi:hypothetical protein